LKSTSGWNDYDGASGNGTDDFGFSALPGGYRYGGGSFLNVGYGGFWWAATEVDASNAYLRDMYYFSDNVNYGNGDEEYGLSVRCVGD
jgi:uncharacterized protein (TIGR02145 family)